MFWLIAGLGNPGLKYRLTRHNLGFLAIDYISEKWGIGLSQKSHQAIWGQGQLGKAPVILLKPQTFMNRSGLSIKSLMTFLGIDLCYLIVIHDDMDLPPGRIRIRDHGGSGGHKGIISVIEHLNTEKFLRIRIGIGRPDPGINPVDYVLDKCSLSEMEELSPVIEKMDKIIETIIIDGPSTAKNIFNN